MALVPRAVAIADRKVGVVAEGVGGFRPEGNRQPRLLQKMAGAFEHILTRRSATPLVADL
eukprot:104303-Heterocapsa_arctica.AAC.1